ncbi:unnamed protein product [Periconia digitata]|uniref:Uncharacterized protein n=1 Tax=Periconia digitata TaxID=1303443 RepID=A0A9W4XUC2_9PLEO|nr:unnamed protein product [Periconia digitata]
MLWMRATRSEFWIPAADRVMVNCDGGSSMISKCCCAILRNDGIERLYASRSGRLRKSS